MSTSGIAASPPLPSFCANATPTPPVVDNDSDDAGAQPATTAPLPPGQGTRIDQLA